MFKAKNGAIVVLLILLCAAGVPTLSQSKTNGDAQVEDKIYTVKELTQKAQILSRPEPTYTEEARKNDVAGTVRVRMVLASSGKVTNVAAITKLPDGLTEKALEAARKIKFKPALKDGRPVSQYVTINYNFDIW
ncbi:MAG: hypothetical protein QOF61_6, partial [Acidobacteriota bacterium]|nr:hypothetical protein [Acidobacteriota bacterium]